ncbi:MAG: IS66 family transposase [Sphaerochaetaceae bacterium]|jgi:transposase|nr:IS66 family transposase [Sphaerochaetaceae bacterium]
MKEHELLQKMAQKIATLEAENTQLREALDQSNDMIAKLTARLDIIDQRSAARARREFSTSSERSVPSDLLRESEDPIAEDSQFDEAETTSPPEEAAVKSPKKKSVGRTPFSDDLPRQEIVLDPEEFAQLEQSKRDSFKRIGEDVLEVLDYQPGVLQVKRYILGKYVDPGNPDLGILQASRPNDRIIRGGMVSNGLLAASFSDKFIYHLPYARQSIRFESIGCPVSRQNLSRWQIQVSNLLDPLVQLIESHLLSQRVLHIDETTLQVMDEEGRENTKKSYIWLRVHDGPQPAASYRYYPSRAALAAEELTDGFAGILQSDGYGAYRSLVKQSDGRLANAFCLTHVRRKFHEIVMGTNSRKSRKQTSPATKGIRKAAQQMVHDIGEIFSLESRLRKQLDHNQISEEQFLHKRKEQAKVLFATFKDHLDQQKKTVIPQTPLAGAINYALNLFDGLQTYLDSIELGPDNSAAERAVRPVALGRANWHFSGSPDGAHSSCAMYTLLQSAKMNHLDPGAYLNHVLDEATLLVDLPYDVQAWSALLPWKFKSEDLSWQDRAEFFTSLD